jgi:hypothetical protein
VYDDVRVSFAGDIPSSMTHAQPEVIGLGKDLATCGDGGDSLTLAGFLPFADSVAADPLLGDKVVGTCHAVNGVPAPCRLGGATPGGNACVGAMLMPNS